jgi:hypothetical protein
VFVVPFWVAERSAVHVPLVPALDVIASDWVASGLPCWFVSCVTVQVSLGFVPWKLQHVKGPICVCATPTGADSVCFSVCFVVYDEFELLHWLTWPLRSARWLWVPPVAADAVADWAKAWVAEAEFEPVIVGQAVPNGGGLVGEIAVGQAAAAGAGPPWLIKKLCADRWSCEAVVALPASRLWLVACEIVATLGPAVLHW